MRYEIWVAAKGDMPNRSWHRPSPLSSLPQGVLRLSAGGVTDLLALFRTTHAAVLCGSVSIPELRKKLTVTDFGGLARLLT